MSEFSTSGLLFYVHSQKIRVTSLKFHLNLVDQNSLENFE